MKDNVIRIRTDKEFSEKVDYLKRINGYKNKSDTIRKTIEKEYVRNTTCLPKVSLKEVCEGMERLADIIVEATKGRKK